MLMAMRTRAEVADHPKARLHRDLVALLRAAGSIEGARGVWLRIERDQRLWHQVTKFGFANAERQEQLNKVAFPDTNWIEVDAALGAGNKLLAICQLATGCALIARDCHGGFKFGRKGLKIIKATGGLFSKM
jgi:hypothetical protein